jgi:hypothetical protein
MKGEARITWTSALSLDVSRYPLKFRAIALTLRARLRFAG